MFDTTMIGRRIKQARIDKNLTQMALADAMGVSYQAVSNWERGNSMPDISKLGDLCATLDLTVNELLGLEEAAPNAVKKAMDNEELTMEELTEVSPMLPPRMLREKLDEKQLEAARVKLEEKKVALKEKMARMKEEMAGKRVTYESDGVSVEESTEHGRRVVHVNVRRASEEEENRENKLDLSRIVDMAPFLDQEYLESLVRSAELKDLHGLVCVAPYLSRTTLDELAERAFTDDLDAVAQIAPFLSAEKVEELISRCKETADFTTLTQLAPFASSTTLDALAENVYPDNIWDLVSIAPFFSQYTLEMLVQRCGDADDFDAMAQLAPFLSQACLDGIIDRYLESGSGEDITWIYPFLSRDAMRSLAARRMDEQNPDTPEDNTPLV